MKQHISLEDLNSLSDKAKERLREWLFLTGYSKPLEGDRKDTVMLISLSIGQMIEYLDESGKWGRINEYGHYCEQVRGCNCGAHEHVYHESDKELCDALWQAVKEVLEQDEGIEYVGVPIVKGEEPKDGKLHFVNPKEVMDSVLEQGDE